MFKPKICPVDGVEFIPKSGIHKFCSETCKGKWKYLSGKLTTESQYKEIAGNWKRYVSRLLYYGGRKRDLLSQDILLKKLEEQDYKCALSGVPLTCNLEKGIKFPTNISVDRIIPGGPYAENNIQLVCRALNSWRADLSLSDYIEWCRKVVEHQDQVKERAKMVKRKRDYR